MMSPKALPVSVPAAVSGEQNASTATATTTTNTTSTAARRGPRWCNRSISFAMLAACVLFGNYWDVLISEGTRKSYIKEAKSKYDSYQNKSKLLRMKSRAKFGKRNPTTTSSNTTTTNNTAANFSETGSQSKHIAQAWSSTQPRLWFREEILSKVNHTLSKEKQGGELPLPPKTMGAFIHLGKTGG